MENIIGKKFDYSRLVEYQEAAVVSRTIINKKAGTVTIFAFDGGQSISAHSAPFDALLQVTEGKAKITIAGKETVLSAPEAVIMPAGISHAVAADGRFKMALIMIKS